MNVLAPSGARSRVSVASLTCAAILFEDDDHVSRVRLRQSSVSELSTVIGARRRGGQKAGVVSLLSSLSKTPETTVRLEGVSREV